MKWCRSGVEGSEGESMSMFDSTGVADSEDGLMGDKFGGDGVEECINMAC